MKRRTRIVLIAATVMAGSASTAFAHPQLGSAGHGMFAGFAHPWLGIDHLLAMIAVGILSVQLGGSARWLLPACFLLTMTAGGALGCAGIGFPGVEPAIAASVVVLGVALAIGRGFSLVAAALVVGGIGLVHGHAHGTEIPALAAPALYAAGFLSATGLLLLAGSALGQLVTRQDRFVGGLRFAGAAMAGVGVLLLVGVAGW